MTTAFQVLVQFLISQLVVLGKLAHLYHMTIHFFKGWQSVKTIPNVSQLLSQGFEICPNEDNYAAIINRNSLCVTDLILLLNYFDCLRFSLMTYIPGLAITFRIQQKKFEHHSCQACKLELDKKFPGNSLNEIQQISVISIRQMSGDYGLYN